MRMEEPQVRWLVGQALKRHPDRGTLRRALGELGLDPRLQKEAFAYGLSCFSEGLCPVHLKAFEIEQKGDIRRAFCRDCKLNWGKPQAWERDHRA